ncbi:MAG: glycosyltransferase family 1 protein [Patescibacteria group bacterium]|jgi:glycosyltransferase involved in cell wall biosynthesis
MKIGIDARFYGPIGKGLGRYTQEVVDNIIKITNAAEGEAFEYVIFLSPGNFDEFDAERSGVRKVKLDCPWYGWKEQLLMPFYLWREKLDLIHFPHFNVPIFTPGKFVVTIHDLILTHFPTVRATTRSHFLYYLKNFAYRLVIFAALSRARKIITVSEFTKKDIVDKFGVRPGKVAVTYEGVANLAKGRDSLFVSKLDSREILAQYHIPQNFLLYVGNAYPHKNLEILLKVFSRLYAEHPDLRLVLVGKLDYFYERVRETARILNLWQKGNINSPVIFPGYVPDAQLEILYAEARAYVFPSLYEGFGLPPLEAMAKGCPVISSDRASLPEILGVAAAYFNPEDEVDMIQKIREVLTDEGLRVNLIEQGLKQAKKYNWWECARETLEVYREALKK